MAADADVPSTGHDAGDPTTVTADALAPAVAADADELTQDAGDRRYKRIPAAQAAELMNLVEGGAAVRDAALQIRMPLRTAYRVLAQSEDQLDTMRGVVRKLMVGQTLERIRDWQVASDVGARKRGNHAPARDWLLHAGVIDPLAGDNAVNVRVAICIGTPEQPMTVTSPQLLDVEGVTE